MAQSNILQRKFTKVLEDKVKAEYDEQDMIEKTASHLIEDERKEEEEEVVHQSQCTDCYTGLIYCQGHGVFHLACFLMLFVIKPPAETMNCFYKDQMPLDKNYPYLMYYKKEETLIANKYQLGFMHLYCFLALFFSDIIDQMSIYNHFTQSIRLSTVPLYIYIIYMTQDSAKRVGELGNIGCYHYEMGNAPQWFNIEIEIFYANLLVLFLMLLWVQFLPGLNL